MINHRHRSIPTKCTTPTDRTCHTVRMDNTRLLYGLLQQGKRSQGGRHKWYKDALKANLAMIDINSAQSAELESGSRQEDDEASSPDNSSEEDFDMEDKSVMPSSFHVKRETMRIAGFVIFSNYCHYKEYTEAKSLALFKVLMAGTAAVWPEGVSSDVLADYQRLIQAYNARYRTPDVLKSQSAREIFSRKQNKGENVDDFVAQMRKIGKVIGADEKLLSYMLFLMALKVR